MAYSCFCLITVGLHNLCSPSSPFSFHSLHGHLNQDPLRSAVALMGAQPFVGTAKKGKECVSDFSDSASLVCPPAC